MRYVDYVEVISSLLTESKNITCDSRQSIASWKEHIKGAAQLLKLRGKAQFNTSAGRMLFRETRAQIVRLLIERHISYILTATDRTLHLGRPRASSLPLGSRAGTRTTFS